jgi:hypothetical protein
MIKCGKDAASLWQKKLIGAQNPADYKSGKSIIRFAMPCFEVGKLIEIFNAIMSRMAEIVVGILEWEIVSVLSIYLMKVFVFYLSCFQHGDCRCTYLLDVCSRTSKLLMISPKMHH